MSLESDVAFYRQIKTDLLASDTLNQFVLIKDGRLIDVYPSYQSAYDAAVAQFGAPGPGEYRFLIKQVLDPEPVETI